MATREDVTIIPFVSPRVALVETPSTEIIAQDLHDTLAAWQDSEEGHSYDILIDSSGKDDLGGGILVGITATLKNTIVGFEQVTNVISSGTCTSTSADGTVLEDTGATFIADGVAPGFVVLNTTDLSMGTVLAVTSETRLELLGMGGGVDNTLTAGDGYKVWEVRACSLSGGNVVAQDDIGDAINPMLPTFGTYPTRTTSSSATTQNQSALEYATYFGRVTVDVTSPYSGTDFPVGTLLQPVNNMTDAHTIADARGLDSFFIRGNITLSAEDFSDGHIFEGQSHGLTLITVDPGADVTNCEFRNCTLTGTLDGGNTLVECEASDLNYVNGSLYRCGLEGTITLSGGVQASFIDCYSEVAGAAAPTINMGGSGQSLIVRGYAGGLKLTNKSGADGTSLDFQSGRLIVDPTVSAGTIYVRGGPEITDDSTGTATIVEQGLSNQNIANTLLNTNLSTFTTAGTVGRTLRLIYVKIGQLFGLG